MNMTKLSYILAFKEVFLLVCHTVPLLVPWRWSIHNFVSLFLLSAYLPLHSTAQCQSYSFNISFIFNYSVKNHVLCPVYRAICSKFWEICIIENMKFWLYFLSVFLYMEVFNTLSRLYFNVIFPKKYFLS